MNYNKNKSPLFRDPIFDGAADPVVIWNHIEKTWWMVYTNRRATLSTPGVEWVHGTDLGIAVSSDGGHTYEYRGIMEGLDIEPGRNTFWAPEIIFEDGTYHMFVTYVSGTPSNWNFNRFILHYTSPDLVHWTYLKKLALSSDKCIDACVHKLPNGNWGLWYKEEKHDSHTYMVEGTDLFHFEHPREVISDCAHEGPNVFYWKNSYWMITDMWKGLGVYKSDDCEHWVRGQNILDTTGTLPDDQGVGHHANIVVSGEEAFIFYFTHPGRNEEMEERDPHGQQRSSIQMRRLELVNGEILCNRDEEFEFSLS